jgi:hypothetical protein
MHYVKQFKINGVDTRQVACITSQGRPNAATEGCVGVLCIDITSPSYDVYKCVAVNGSIHTWELLSSGMSIISATITGGGASSFEFAYTNLRTPYMYVVKIGDLILDSKGYLYQVVFFDSTRCTAKYCDVNLVASTHTHPVEGIDGIMPIEKGGTNADSLEKAKSNLGIELIEEVLKAYFILGTPGLAYELDGETYVCTGIGTATASNITISPAVEGTRVTAIGEKAFQSNKKIVTVIIPEGITNIGNYAFAECRYTYGSLGITTIVVPASVTTIGDYAFSNFAKTMSTEVQTRKIEVHSCFFYYNGTVEQWNAIKFGESWNQGMGTSIIKCSDSEVSLKK